MIVLILACFLTGQIDVDKLTPQDLARARKHHMDPELWASLMPTEGARRSYLKKHKMLVHSGSHRALVVLVERYLTLSQRKVLQAETYGTDGNAPSRVVDGVYGDIDGHEFRLPKYLVNDCGDVNFFSGWEGPRLKNGKPAVRFNPCYQSPSFAFDESGSALKMTMLGGDGAGSYVVRWILPKSGKPSRKFYDAESYLNNVKLEERDRLRK